MGPLMKIKNRIVLIRKFAVHKHALFLKSFKFLIHRQKAQEY